MKFLFWTISNGFWEILIVPFSELYAHQAVQHTQISRNQQIKLYFHRAIKVINLAVQLHMLILKIVACQENSMPIILIVKIKTAKIIIRKRGERNLFHFISFRQKKKTYNNKHQTTNIYHFEPQIFNDSINSNSNLMSNRFDAFCNLHGK